MLIQTAVIWNIFSIEQWVCLCVNTKSKKGPLKHRYFYKIIFKDFSFEISPYTFLKSIYLLFNEVLMMLIDVIMCSKVLSWQYKNPGLLSYTICEIQG